MRQNNPAVLVTAPAPTAPRPDKGASPLAVKTRHAAAATIDRQHALSILRDFYIECRRHFRHYDRLDTSVTLAGRTGGVIRFTAPGFDLNLSIKEGGRS